MCLRVAFGVALATTLNAAGSAQADDNAEAAARNLPAYVIQQISLDPTAFMEGISKRLHAMSPDGIVTAEMLEKAIQRDLAAERAKVIAKLLAFDLDGDGALSAEEIFAGSKRDESTLHLLRLNGDTDGDGSISFAELMAHAKIAANMTRRRDPRSRPEQIRIFDANGDGTVDLPEVLRVYNAVVRLKLGLSAGRRERTRRRGQVEPRPRRRDRPAERRPDPGYIWPPLRGDRRGFASPKPWAPSIGRFKRE